MAEYELLLWITFSIFFFFLLENTALTAEWGRGADGGGGGHLEVRAEPQQVPRTPIADYGYIKQWGSFAGSHGTLLGFAVGQEEEEGRPQDWSRTLVLHYTARVRFRLKS